MDRLEQRARELHADAVPSPALRARIRDAVLTRSNVPSPPRRALLLGAAALTSVGCLVGTGVLLLLPGTLVQPTPAFAQVQAAMSTIRQAHWTVREISYDSSGKEAGHSSGEYWASLTPPRYASREDLYKPATASAPAQMVKGYRHLQQTTGWIYYDAGHDRYIRHPQWPFRVPPEESERNRALRDYILSQIMLPPGKDAPPADKPFPAYGPGESVRFPGAKWTVSSARLNGQRADLFVQDYVPPSHPEWQRYLQTKLWVDPKTRRVLRREQRQWHPPHGPVAFLTIAENFRYDDTPPPGTFTLTPPPGATVLTRGASLWNRLTSAEKQALQQAIAHTEQGWQQGDFAQFAADWNFAFPTGIINATHSTDHRRQWQDQVQHQKGRWAEWRSRITDVTSPSDVTPALFFRVHVHTEGKWADNGQTWEGNAYYLFLRDNDNKPRIVDWQRQTLYDRITKEHRIGSEETSKP